MSLFDILIPVLAFVIALAIGAVAGFIYRKNVAEKEIKSAEEEAKRIVNEAIKAAESKRREALLEAKEEILRNRTEFERESRERRIELSRLEKRLQQKEETLDRKSEHLERKDEVLSQKIRACEEKTEEADRVVKRQIDMLENISGMKSEEAKEFLLKKIESEIRQDAAARIRAVEEELKDEADQKAREIITVAIQRCAADHASEATVSVVSLPNDEMKGRIIGREGRNIRTIETMTGVDLIIDDTPEAITLSAFDPVRREIARIALTNLISDGRIHPARIEEMVEKAKKEVEQTIKQEGERALFETGVHGVNLEIVKLLGKLKYRTSYGQNVLMHSIEVAHIAGNIAAELGIDINLAKRAGLLHDIGKAIDHEMEGSHVSLGAEFARKYKENPEVIHAIESHHGDVEIRTVIAGIVQAADAVSAARPGARRENLENYIKRLEKLEDIASSFPGVEKTFAIQAGREIRIMVKPEEVNDESIVLLARDITKKIEDDLEYPGQIKVHVVRESRAIEYAK